MKKQVNKSRSKIGTVKWMQTASTNVWDTLSLLSNKKGITVQDYLRAIVIPNHLEMMDTIALPKKYSKRAKKSWATRRRNKALHGTEKVTELKLKEPWEVRPEPLPGDQSG